jgi:hypothetical protein
MERVVAIGLESSLGAGRKLPNPINGNNGRVENGIIVKVLTPGRFIVGLSSGQKIQVLGSDSLATGHRVQVSWTVLKEAKSVSAISPIQNSLEVEGYTWSAFIPLGFGGEGSFARLEVFVEKRRKMILEKFQPGVYFVFTAITRDQGELQWSVYLKERQVALQIHSDSGGSGRKRIEELARIVEKRLKSLGFVLTVPTVFLSKRFKPPSGFRLNVRG